MPKKLSAHKKVMAKAVALTIAGSDSGGGAGLQADLKTFMALDVFGTSVVTCITAQNPERVLGVAPIDAQLISLQLQAVCESFPVVAAKTGMLYSIPVIQAVADALRSCPIPHLVVDPVMVSTSGAQLLREDAIEMLGQRILKRATIITPNLDEAAILCGRPLDDLAAQEDAARELAQRFEAAVLIKGGHRDGPAVVDVLAIDDKLHRLALPRVALPHPHGTGCTLSAALTAFLARGETLLQAVTLAKRFVYESLRRAAPVGQHYPLAFAAAGAKLIKPGPRAP